MLRYIHEKPRRTNLKSILLPKIVLTFHCLNKLFCRQSRAWALDRVDGIEEADATQVEEVFHLRPPKKKPGPIQFSSLFSSVCTNVQTSYFRHQGKTCKIHNQPHCRLQVGCYHIFRDSERSHEILEFGLQFWSEKGTP